MRVTNLCDLLNADLLNKPKISSINGFCFDLKDCKNECVFISTNKNDDEVQKAIQSGAYAIISQHDITVKNDEIAILKVSNIKTALTRLIRFTACYKKLKFSLLNTIQYATICKISLDKKAKILNSDFKKRFLDIMNANDGDIFFSDDEKLLQKTTAFYDFVFSDDNVQNVSENSLFYLSFICDDVYYQNIIYPKIFLKALCGLIKYLNKFKIAFKMPKDLGIEGHFDPIFVDKFYNIKSFGDSYRAFIVENDLALFEIEANFLRSKFGSDIVVCASHNLQTDIKIDFRFTSLSALQNLYNFRYALVFCEKNDLLDSLNQKETQKTLF